MRIAMMVLRKLYLVPFLFYRIWLAGKKYIGDYMPGFLIGKKISTHAIQAGNITPEIHGLENIPKEDGFIFYPNHQGLFDVLMFFYSSPKPFAFVIKKEAKNVILLKQAIQARFSSDGQRRSETVHAGDQSGCKRSTAGKKLYYFCRRNTQQNGQ